MSVVTAYQTLEDRDNIDEIETDGPYECRRKDAWLGFGYYFWDTNMQWAITWGEASYKKMGREYVIGRCQINLSSHCFDLVGNVQHQLDLIEMIEVMKESGLLKPNHKFILPNILAFARKKGLFNFKAIRSSDEHYKKMKLYFSTKQDHFMVINQRIQICVVEKKDVILHPFKVIYPEKYLY